MSIMTLKAAITEILCSANPRMTAQCIDVALGLGIEGKTQTEIAKENGFTRAAVNWQCRQIQQTYSEEVEQ